MINKQYEFRSFRSTAYVLNFINHSISDVLYNKYTQTLQLCHFCENFINYKTLPVE